MGTTHILGSAAHFKMSSCSNEALFWVVGAVTPKLDGWVQQIPGTTTEISVQKSGLLGTAKILHRTLRLPGL